MINFFTFKWGNKYDYKYVNRLYGSIKKHCNVPFKFHCITENPVGISDEIEWIEYNDFDPFDYPKDQIFTREKLVLFKEFKKGKNVWVDLDFLIHNNILFVVLWHNCQSHSIKTPFHFLSSAKRTSINKLYL